MYMTLQPDVLYKLCLYFCLKQEERMPSMWTGKIDTVLVLTLCANIIYFEYLLLQLL